jgi:hypothetical protein
VPQLKLRLAPQLSFSLGVPHVSPILVQCAAFVSPAQPQTLAVPLPPHVLGAVQPAPKLQSATVRLVPQLSAAVTPPQFFPSLLQNAGFVSLEHAQTFGVPLPPHVWGDVHVPHETTVRLAPQLSVPVTPPQVFPSRMQNAESVSGVQLAGPHTLDAPQTSGETHVPHAATRMLPQLSVADTLPQFFPCLAQNAPSVSATHPQTLTVPPPPQA